MSEALYQKAILDHARAAVGAGQLADPHGRATVDNPVCGDRVTFEVRLTGDTIEGVAHKVRGCLLCEAAASVIAAKAVGLRTDQIRSVAEAVDRMIRNDGPLPPDWPELQAFMPVRAVRSRHECVLLPFRAADRALAEAAASTADRSA